MLGCQWNPIFSFLLLHSHLIFSWWSGSARDASEPSSRKASLPGALSLYHQRPSVFCASPPPCMALRSIPRPPGWLKSSLYLCLVPRMQQVFANYCGGGRHTETFPVLTSGPVSLPHCFPRQITSLSRELTRSTKSELTPTITVGTAREIWKLYHSWLNSFGIKRHPRSLRMLSLSVSISLFSRCLSLCTLSFALKDAKQSKWGGPY